MARIHAFEFEDLSWFPTNIRNYGTDFLQFVTNKFDFYKGVAPLLISAMKETKRENIIDLASGGGGAWKSFSKHLTEEIPNLEVTLSDYYPNFTAFKKMEAHNPAVFDYHKTPVSALDVPAQLKGFRTQFLSFHHFKPADAQQILQNAVNAKQPIAIFEGQVRDVSHFIKNFFSPISVLLMTPFIKPFSWGRLLFTYLIPIVPLFVWWDGIISVLRTYSVKEMQGLIDALDNKEQFNWQVGQHKQKGITVPYLIGTPK